MSHVLILAAGKGERMRSELPKVLHPLGGRPLLSYSLEIARSLRPKKTVVLVGHKADQVKSQFDRNGGLLWALQREQRGTGHGVLCGLEALREKKGSLFILYGDVPLLRVETLREMENLLTKEKAALAFLTTRLENPTGYGRVLRGEYGQILRIVEEKEATPGEAKVTEVNSGIYLARIEEILEPLRRVKKSLIKGEYYLTDLVEALLKEGKKVVSLDVEDPFEVMGINSQEELSRMDGILQARIRRKWMDRGVTLVDPESIRIEADVELASGVILHPGVILRGPTTVGEGTEILPYSVVEESAIGSGARIGPFAHLRPGSIVEDRAHVGNFVELKKTRLGRGAKANHLAYLGDAEIGAGANIGAGTITCNYDGRGKYKTIIGEGAFIGSDTQLVAPVRVGKGAYVGSGTTVTKDVPAGSLALSRVEQKNILNWKQKK